MYVQDSFEYKIVDDDAGVFGGRGTSRITIYCNNDYLIIEQHYLTTLNSLFVWDKNNKFEINFFPPVYEISNCWIKEHFETWNESPYYFEEMIKFLVRHYQEIKNILSHEFKDMIFINSLEL